MIDWRHDAAPQGAPDARQTNLGEACIARLSFSSSQHSALNYGGGERPRQEEDTTLYVIFEEEDKEKAQELVTKNTNMIFF